MSKLDEIARVAGVSRHTASRILNGRRLEKWPAKREQGDRIRRVAEELGYRPNIASRTLVLGRYNCVGLLLSTDADRGAISQTTLTFLDKELMGRGQRMTLFHLSDDRLTDSEYMAGILREWLCDGLIVNYQAAVPARMRKLVEDFKIPVVWLNSNHDKDSVYADDYDAASQTVKRLGELGHNNIAYVDHDYYLARREGIKHYSRDARREGCLDAVSQSGGRFTFLHDPDKSSDPDLRDALTAVLKSATRPTGFVCGSFESARAVTEAACSAGLRVPQDLSCIIFRGERSKAGSLWDDSAMVFPEHEMGREAVRLVMRKIAQPQVEIASVKLRYSLFEGRTIACRL